MRGHLMALIQSASRICNWGYTKTIYNVKIDKDSEVWHIDPNKVNITIYNIKER